MQRGQTRGAESATNYAGLRLARLEEIASTAQFLLSDEASFIDGWALPVDGGIMA